MEQRSRDLWCGLCCLPTPAGLTLEVPLLHGDPTEGPAVRCLFRMSYSAVAVAASFS